MKSCIFFVFKLLLHRTLRSCSSSRKFRLFLVVAITSVSVRSSLVTYSYQYCSKEEKKSTGSGWYPELVFLSVVFSNY